MSTQTKLTDYFNKSKTVVGNTNGKNGLKKPPSDQATTTPVQVNKSSRRPEERSSPETKRLKLNVETKEVPAYIKYKRLVDGSTESSLPLPVKFKFLLELFESADKVLTILHGRHEVKTFNRLKEGVERMTRKRFDTKRLCQIVTVYPDAYVFSYEKGIPISSEKRVQQMIISFKDASSITPSFMLTRKQHFIKKLRDITKKYHTKYLKSLDPPVVVSEDEILRWHPKFQLENVPNIEPNYNIMPDAPLAKPKSVEQFLGKQQCSNTIEVVKTDEPKIKIKSGALKGLSTALLEKIRNKEAIAMAEKIKRKPECEKKISMLNRLEKFIRTVHCLFISEKCNVLPIETIVDKCADQFPNLSKPEVMEHIRLTAEVLPNWFLILEVSKGIFGKILDKEMSLQSFIERIQTKIKLCK